MRWHLLCRILYGKKFEMNEFLFEVTWGILRLFLDRACIIWSILNSRRWSRVETLLSSCTVLYFIHSYWRRQTTDVVFSTNAAKLFTTYFFYFIRFFFSLLQNLHNKQFEFERWKKSSFMRKFQMVKKIRKFSDGSVLFPFWHVWNFVYYFEN